MPERDLTTICSAIPCAGGDISTQAHNILFGLTGEDKTFDISTGGEQPTLFSPSISNNWNTYSSNRSSSNGGFGDVLKTYVGDTEVSNPYNATSADNGKLYRAISSATNFNPGVNQTIIVYHHSGSGTTGWTATGNIPDGCTIQLNGLFSNASSWARKITTFVENNVVMSNASPGSGNMPFTFQAINGEGTHYATDVSVRVDQSAGNRLSSLVRGNSNYGVVDFKQRYSPSDVGYWFSISGQSYPRPNYTINCCIWSSDLQTKLGEVQWDHVNGSISGACLQDCIPAAGNWISGTLVVS